MTKPFATEADLVTAFIGCIDRDNARPTRRRTWMMYAESAGFDLLAVADNGVQVGIEAKLTLNVKVVAQALSCTNRNYRDTGPDCRAVLIPSGGLQNDLTAITRHIGLGILTVSASEYRRDPVEYHPQLPDEDDLWRIEGWHPWLPERRCELPEYVPDVIAGKPSPLSLTK